MKVELNPLIVFNSRRLLNRQHPIFGLKTRIGEREWWHRLIKGINSSFYLFATQKILKNVFNQICCLMK